MTTQQTPKPKPKTCGECRFFGTYATQRGFFRVCSKNPEIMLIRRENDRCMFKEGGAR